MKNLLSRYTVGLALILSPTLGVGLNLAQAQEMLPGLWEFKTNMRMPKMPDLSAQMAQMRDQLKNLPPEARQMLEQQLAGMGSGLTESGALRLCITEDEAAEDVIKEGQSDGDCTYTKVERKGNTWRGQLACKEEGGSGEFTTTLHSPSHFSTVANMTSKEHGRIDMKTEARRISSDCGKLQPLNKRR